MLNAPTETPATPRIGSRQPQTRDSKPPQTDFTSLVDDNAAPQPKASRSGSAHETDTAPRSSASQKTRDSRAHDDRTPRDADDATALPADDPFKSGQSATNMTEASAEKPAATISGPPGGPAPDVVTQSASDVIASDAAGVAPDAAVLTAPVALTTPAVPIAAIVPVVGAATPEPLKIAAAGIAAGKTAGKAPATKTSDAAPASTDAPDQAISAVPDATGEPIPVSMTVSKARVPAVAPGDTAAVAVEIGFTKPIESEPRVGPAANAADPAVAKSAATPETPGTEAKPKTAAATADTAGPPAAASVPSRERHAGTPATAAASDSLSDVPQLTAPQLTPHNAAAASPNDRLTATIATAAPIPLNGLAVELAARAQSGVSRFDIRLDPAELGRIDVRIDIDRNGQVTSHLTVEKPETLAMLRQDSPQLQRALNDAGLKTADGALQFTLGDQSQPRHNSDSGARQAQRFTIRDDETVAPATPVRGYGRTFAARSGVDISV